MCSNQISAGRDKEKIKAMFGSIANGYDFLNHTLSLGLDRWWRKVLVDGMRGLPPGPILDLAAGTFDVSIALGKTYPERRILAVDLCLPMLLSGLPKITRVKNQSEAVRKPFSAIAPLAADAMLLPLRDCSLAGITVAFGLRNMRPRENALAEMRRVLRPGGRLRVLEFGSAKPKVWLGLYNFYLAYVLPRIGGFVSGDRQAYEYLAETIREFPLAGDLAAELSLRGFRDVRCTKLTGGIVYLYQGIKQG